MIVVFVIFAAILIWFSCKSFMSGIRYLEFFRSELRRTVPTWTPLVTVICPCRGIDQGMEENLASLLEQDFPAYEVLFVVDDACDPAAAVIERVIAGEDSIHPAYTRLCAKKLLVAPKATDSAQKVENLRFAIGNASDTSQIFVFADSDTRVSPTWLRHLVGPLEDTSVGAASGYRWFISERPTFASEMRSVWNASIASALGPNSRSNFCWGGSTAIRRDTFERIGMQEKWRGTLSDDFAVTRALSAEKMSIVHVPQALTATVENCSWPELVEFTTRQMKITRVYMPHLWAMSLIGSAIFCSVMLASLLIILSKQNTLAFWSAVITLVAVTVLSIGKSWLRLKAVRLALPQYGRELRRQSLTQNTLWLVTPALFLYNAIAAFVSRDLVWRGTKYRLKSPTETVIIRSE